MKVTHIVPIAALAVAVLLGGCATNGSVGAMGSQANDRYGVIESINISTGRSSGMNAGTVIGGGVGAIAGNHFGGGNGKAGTTVTGAVGGAVAGTALENSNGSRTYNIAVRLDNGSYETVTQAGSVADLRVGERVRIENGLAYRA